MKAYTDLDQSKKLAEILPLESADMYYFDDNGGEPNFKVRNGITYYYDSEDCLCCWSLTALLEVLKYPSLTQDVENKWSIMEWTGAYPKSEYDFDNAIDACVAIIEKLHELKIL